MDKFVKGLKESIIDKLHDYKRVEVYPCDMASTLFESENATGSVLCNTYYTKEFIKQHFDLFGALVEKYEKFFNTTLNPFKEPEKCHVMLLIDCAESLLSEVNHLSRNWGRRIELNDEVIDTIIEELNEINIKDEDLI